MGKNASCEPLASPLTKVRACGYRVCSGPASVGLVPTQAEVTVLLSGGIDSATVAALLLATGHVVDALFVDYGQPAKAAEQAASHAIARHYRLPWRATACEPAPSGSPLGRNDLLVAVAQRAVGGRSVAIGIHAGSAYSDCSPEWRTAWQALLDLQHGGAVQLLGPLVQMNKPEVYALARDLAVPIALTYSCDAEAGPCATCPSCSDRILGLVDV